MFYNLIMKPKVLKPLVVSTDSGSLGSAQDMKNSHVDIDAALKDLGQFGPFQVVCFILLMFPVMLSGFRYTEYIFTTLDIPHRCRVPECEGDSGAADFSPPWLADAIPFTSHQTPEVCQRYRIWPNATHNTSTCSAQMFDDKVIEICDDWVFSEPARTVANDFNIMCPEDYWKRTIIGSYSLISGFIGLPLAGYFSDRCGRKTVLVYASTILAVTGITRSFAFNYAMLATLELFDGLIMWAVYDPSFLLGLETLAPSKRLTGVMIISTYFALGQVVLAGLVWWAQDWRLLLRIFYVPMLAVVVLHWMLPESIHWLYTKQMYSEVETVFRKIAKLNNTAHKLPNVINELKDAEQLKDKHKNEDKDKNKEESTKDLKIREVLKSKIIMKRLVVCALCRGACSFTYFGLSQNSLQSEGNHYLSFLLVSLVEMPGYIASGYLPGISFLGRRGCTAVMFFTIAIACTAMFFISHEQVMLNMLLSMLSKFSVTIGVTVIFLYTAEVFPTELRHSLLCVCGICSSIAIIASQQISLIKVYIDPVLIYGVVSFLGGALVLTGPETLNTKLPDTIQEAENIGRKHKTRDKSVLASSSTTLDSHPMSASIKTIETIA